MKLVKEELFEAEFDQTLININNELDSFIKGVVIPKSKGKAKDEKTAAYLLIDILKRRYKLGEN